MATVKLQAETPKLDESLTFKLRVSKNNPVIAQKHRKFKARQVPRDVKRTPSTGAPVAYSSVRDYGNAQDVTTKTFANGNPIFTKKSFSPDCGKGAEPGSMKGVAIPGHMDHARAKEVRLKIKAEGDPVTFVGAVQEMNVLPGGTKGNHTGKLEGPESSGGGNKMLQGMAEKGGGELHPDWGKLAEIGVKFAIGAGCLFVAPEVGLTIAAGVVLYDLGKSWWLLLHDHDPEAAHEASIDAAKDWLGAAIGGAGIIMNGAKVAPLLQEAENASYQAALAKGAGAAADAEGWAQWADKLKEEGEAVESWFKSAERWNQLREAGDTGKETAEALRGEKKKKGEGVSIPKRK